MSGSDPEGLDLFLRNWILTEGYTLVCLIAAMPSDLDLARTRLREECPTLIRFPVSTLGLARFQEFIQEDQKLERMVAWLEQPDFDPLGWQEILPILNLHRDSIGRKAPIFLVLAGPPGLEDLLMHHAGDLYDVADHRELKRPSSASDGHPVADLTMTYRKAMLENFPTTPSASTMAAWKLRLDPNGRSLNIEIPLERQFQTMREGIPFRAHIDGDYHQLFPLQLVHTLAETLTPFYVPLVTYVRDHLFDGLARFIDLQIQTLLKLHDSIPWIEKSLLKGSTVLVLDGTDLNESDEVSQDLFHQINSFVRIWPRISIVLLVKTAQSSWVEHVDLPHYFLISPGPGPLTKAAPSGLPAKAIMPFLPYASFIGRERDLTYIHKTLYEGPDHVLVVKGLGGIGKTQLAIQYAWHYGAYYSGVYWISMADPNLVPGEIIRCGESLGLFEPGNVIEMVTRIGKVKAFWKNTSEKYLLIFDNCEEENLAIKWLPQNQNIKILVTSRSVSLQKYPQLALGFFQRHESVKLLYQLNPNLFESQAYEIAEKLDNFPLALQLAGQFMTTYRVTPEDYLRQLSEEELNHPSLQGWAVNSTPTSHETNVARTLAISINRLNIESAEPIGFRDLLARTCFFATGVPIDKFYIRTTLPDSFPFEKAINRLIELGILTEKKETINLNRLVSDYYKSTLSSSEYDVAQSTVIQVVLNIAKVAKKSGQPKQITSILPHLYHLLSTIGENHANWPELAAVLYSLNEHNNSDRYLPSEPVPALPQEMNETDQNAAKVKSSNKNHLYAPNTALPQELFVGRKEQLAALVRGLLGDASVQLVILIEGGRGVGKTSLAREVARRHGTHFGAVIELLVADTTPQFLAMQLAQRLGVTIDEPLDPSQAQRAISALLHGRRLLLLLDNLDQLEYAPYLLPEGSRCAVLITTRERHLTQLLHQKRRDLVVTSVKLDVFSREENLELFRELLRDRYRSDEEAVYDEIAALLGYLPVALRLALNWLVFPPELDPPELLTRLQHDTPLKVVAQNQGPDHELRTLDAVFALNQPQLDTASRHALNLLAQCAPGPVPLDFLQALHDGDGEALWETLETLHSHNWCSHKKDANGRSYELHVLLRELLRARQTDPALPTAFLDLIRRTYTDDELHFTIKDRWLEQLHEALKHWHQAPDDRLADLVYGPFNRFCERRGHGALFIELAQLVQTSFPTDQKLQAVALAHQALILSAWGKLDEAMALHRQEQDLCEALGDRAGLSRCYGNQATILWAWGKLDEAMALLRQQQDLCEALGDRAGLSRCYGNQALILMAWGKLDEAMALLRQQQDLCEALGDRAGLSRSYGNQAIILKAWGKLGEAMALHRQEQDLFGALGDRAGLSRCYGNQATILRAWGKLDEAMALHRQEQDLCEALGDRAGLSQCFGNQALILKAWGKLDEAMSLHRQEEDLCEALGDRAGLAICWWNMGDLFKKLGQPQECLRHWRQAIELQLALGLPLKDRSLDMEKMLAALERELVLQNSKRHHIS